MKSSFLLAAGMVVGSVQASPSAPMRFMEHLHGSGVDSQSPDRGGEGLHLYVSKRAWVEDRACTRLSRTPHLITTSQSTWFPTAVEMAEGFYSADVAALAC
ncbi:unnamed protein product [Ectocarpus sp. 12 AP-2014]